MNQREQRLVEPDAKSNIERFGLKGPQTRSYQPADWEVVDYQMYDFRGSGIYFRGPADGRQAPDARADAGSVAILGAAQIFGRLCEAPLGDLVERQTGTRVYNFGYTGASPAFFLQFAPLMDFLSGCRTVVLQLMSARSVSNALFDCSDRFPNRLTRRSDNQTMFVNDAYKWALATLPQQQVADAVMESRATYVDLMTQLIAAIPVPVHLLWFSDRRPAYEMRFHHFNGLFGDFPQLVNDGMVQALQPKADGYTEVAGARGRPHYLYSRFGTGQRQTVDVFPLHDPKHENYYYPTPEMHEDAAALLGKAIRNGDL